MFSLILSMLLIASLSHRLSIKKKGEIEALLMVKHHVSVWVVM